MLTADELIIDLVNTIGNNGNYMINLGPRPDGTFEPEQIELMDKLGEWILKHSKAIYETRGGPYYPYKQGVSTFRENKAWLFISDGKAKKVLLPGLKQKIVSAKIFGSSTEVPFHIQNKGINFDVSKVKYPGPVKVIELEFDGEVEMPENN